jgi:hypothetical protein
MTEVVIETALLENQLVSLCNAIGGYEVSADGTGKEEYVMGDECLGKRK